MGFQLNADTFNSEAQIKRQVLLYNARAVIRLFRLQHIGVTVKFCDGKTKRKGLNYMGGGINNQAALFLFGRSYVV